MKLPYVTTTQPGITQPEPIFIQQENGDFAKPDDAIKHDNSLLFSVPSPFDAVCNNHLFEIENMYDQFKQKGVDEIYCISVFDINIMKSWAKSLDVTKVKMLSDPTTEFTKAMAMLVSLPRLGYRSWRYAIYINSKKEIDNIWTEEGQNNLGLHDNSYIRTNPDNVINSFS